MKALKLILTGFIVTGATFLAAETLPNRGPLPFSAYDKDNNNVITEKEFNTIKAQRMTQKAQSGTMMRNAGNAPIFSDIDSNSDNIITKQELQTHQQKRFSQRVNQKGAKGMNQGKGQSW